MEVAYGAFICLCINCQNKEELNEECSACKVLVFHFSTPQDIPPQGINLDDVTGNYEHISKYDLPLSRGRESIALCARLNNLKVFT